MLTSIIHAVNGTSKLQTFSGDTTSDAKVILENSEVQVNQSVCNISSLEVYRGREQAIEISHKGFSLGNLGTIEV